MAVAFQAAGTKDTSNTSTIAPGWPAHQADDIGLLIVQSENETIALTTANGFAEVTNSPQATGAVATAGSVKLAVFWCRATGSSMSAPVVTAVTNHLIGQIITFRGCITSGNPINVTAGGVLGSADTAFSIPGATTTIAACLIAAIIAHSNDTTAAQLSGWTNASLASMAEATGSDVSTNAGNGGGFGTGVGIKTTAGTYDATTGNIASASLQALLSLALMPPNTTTTKTQSGIARVRVTATKTQPGVSRIRVTEQQTQTGIANIDVGASVNTQSGIARITAEATKAQTGISRVRTTQNIGQSGISRIRTQEAQAQTGISRVSAPGDATQNGISRITANDLQAQTGISRITSSTSRNQSSIASVRVTETRNQAGIAEIVIPSGTARTQLGIASVIVSSVQLQTGKARVRIIESPITADDMTNMPRTGEILIYKQRRYRIESVRWDYHKTVIIMDLSDVN